MIIKIGDRKIKQKIFVVLYNDIPTVGFCDIDNAFEWIANRGGEQIVGFVFTNGYTIKEIDMLDEEK